MSMSAERKKRCPVLNLFPLNMKDEQTVFKFESMRLGLEPVDGVVQPPVVPPDGKPHRNTNTLQFILKNILSGALFKHRKSWPFIKPVDTAILNLPDYHRIIKYPMDFTTIKRRIENCYYYDAEECIIDVAIIFYNCYKFNSKQDDVYKMGHTLERIFLKIIGKRPKKERTIPLPTTVARRSEGPVAETEKLLRQEQRALAFAMYELAAAEQWRSKATQESLFTEALTASVEAMTASAEAMKANAKAFHRYNESLKVQVALLAKMATDKPEDKKALLEKEVYGLETIPIEYLEEFKEYYSERLNLISDVALIDDNIKCIKQICVLEFLDLKRQNFVNIN